MRFAPEDYARVQADHARRVAAAQKAASTATPTMANNIVGDQRRYPWLSPAVNALLNQAGVSESVREAAAYAAAGAKAKAGEIPDLDTPAPAAKKKKGWWASALGAVGDVVGAAGTGLKDAFGGDRGLYGAAKGVSRPVTAAMAAPYEVVQGALGVVFDDVKSSIGGQSEADKGDRGGWAGIFKQTQLAQAIAHPNEMGTGWFASEQIRDRQSEMARKVRGTDPTGKAWTVGRMAASPIPEDWGPKLAGKSVHDIVSGTVDVASAIALDPVNIATAHTADIAHLPTGAIGQMAQGPIARAVIRGRLAEQAAQFGRAGELVSEASKITRAAEQLTAGAATVKPSGITGALAAITAKSAGEQAAARAAELVAQAETLAKIPQAAARNPEWADTVRAAAGLVAGPKGETALDQRHLRWLMSKEGQHAVDTLTNVKDPATVLGLYKGKIGVKAAVELADADTPEKVIGALGRALEIGPGMLRNPNPTATLKGLAMRSWIGEKMPTTARAMGYVPNGTWMAFDDPEKSVATLFDVLGNAKITGEARTDLMNRWSRAFANEDRAAMYRLGVETNDQIAKGLVDAGMHPEDAKQLTRSFYKDSETIRLYTSEDMAAMVDGSFLDGDPNSIVRWSQIVDGGWGLMDPQAVEKVRIQTGRMAKLLGQEGSYRRMPLTGVRWYQNHIFKPAAILRPALLGRLLPDEALRVLTGGHVVDSGSLFTAIANHPRASALGELFDAPGKIMEVDKQIGKLAGNAQDAAAIVDRFKANADLTDLLRDLPEAAHGEIADLSKQYHELAPIRQKMALGDTLTRDEARIVDDLSFFVGEDSSLAVVDKRLHDLESRAARLSTDNPELAALYEQRAALERQWQRGHNRVIDVLTGKRGNGTIAKRFDGVGAPDSHLYRTRTRIIIPKGDSRLTEQYISGLIDEIQSQAADPVYRRIANGGLLPGDTIAHDWSAVSGHADQYNARLADAHEQMAALDAEHDAILAKLADHQAATDEALAPLAAPRDQLMAQRDAGRRRIADLEQQVDRLERRANTVIYDPEGPAIRRRLTEAQDRLAGARTSTENELEQLARTAADDPKTAARAKAIENRLKRQQETVDRLAEQYAKTNHAEYLDAQERLTAARRDLTSNRAAEGAVDYKGQLAEHRKTIAAARKEAKKGEKAIRAEIDAVLTKRGIIEKRMGKIESAFQRGILDADGFTHLGTDPTTLDHVKDWLWAGSGRKYAEDFARASGNKLDREFVSKWVDVMSADVESHWGNNQEIRSAIASGRLRNQNIVVEGRQWGPKRTPSEIVREWAKEFAATDEAPRQIRYEPSLEEVRRKGSTFASRAGEQRTMLVDKLFSAFYGNASDRFIRIPEYARSYWSNMEQLIPRLEPDEAARLIENAAEAGLAKSQLDRITSLARGASGEGLLEDADQVAHGWALDDVKRLLFDMDRKNQFQDMANLVAPFGRAWWEVISTWGKIGSTDVLGGRAGRVGGAVANAAMLAHKADKGIAAARGAGIFHKDEYGQEVFTYPLSGELASIVARVANPGAAATVKSMFRGKVAGLSIGTQVLPGIGPAVSLPAYELAQHAPQDLQKLLFPFGPPESLAGAAMPAWFEKLNSAWNSDENEQVYGNTLMEAARALANASEPDPDRPGQVRPLYPRDADGLDRLMRDARRQATALTALRGIAQAIVPSAPIPTYLAETKNGDTVVAALSRDLDDLRKHPEKVAELGAQTPTEAFIAKWGPQAIGYIFGKTKTISGGETASEAFGRWQESNMDLAEKYPNVYAYFGPQGSGYSLTVQQRQLELGTREKRTPEEILRLTNAKLGDLAYYGMKDALLERNRKAGVNELTDEQRQWLTAKRAELEDALPGWDVEARSAESRARLEKQIAQLRQASLDPKVAETPTGKSLRQYMVFRAKAIDEATKRGITGWGQANATEDLRKWLTGKAVKLGQADAGFLTMFDDVLSREMKD